MEGNAWSKRSALSSAVLFWGIWFTAGQNAVSFIEYQDSMLCPSLNMQPWQCLKGEKKKIDEINRCWWYCITELLWEVSWSIHPAVKTHGCSHLLALPAHAVKLPARQVNSVLFFPFCSHGDLLLTAEHISEFCNTCLIACMLLLQTKLWP